MATNQEYAYLAEDAYKTLEPGIRDLKNSNQELSEAENTSYLSTQTTEVHTTIKAPFTWMHKPTKLSWRTVVRGASAMWGWI